MTKKNRPQCPLCGSSPYKHGTTSKGTPRWMCQQCRYSYTNTNHDAIQAARFRLFITWLTEGLTLNQVARRVNKSPRTLQRWFEPFWLIEVPDVKDKERIYDQIFIDGTYFNTRARPPGSRHILGVGPFGYSNTPTTSSDIVGIVVVLVVTARGCSSWLLLSL